MDRGVLMNGPMSLKCADRSKTQTRRPMNPQPKLWVVQEDGEFFEGVGGFPRSVEKRQVKHPHGVPGDRLYVRETWATDRYFNHLAPKDIPESAQVAERCAYRHGERAFVEGWDMLRPSIHMPRWAARTWLTVTRVWVERLQNMNGYDAQAEGILANCDSDLCDGVTLREFADLWDDIYAGKGLGWGANPWVFCTEFTKVER